MDNEHTIRLELIKHLRGLYESGFITNKYNYNIYSRTTTFLIDYLETNHPDVINICDITREILVQFLSYLLADRTQKQFFSIHREIVNKMFSTDITSKDLKRDSEL